jgi:hypothetical protein
VLLTKLEAEELLDHLQQSPDLWMESEETPGLWLHSNEEAEAVCALQVLPGETFVEVQATPLGWSEEQTQTYLQSLVEHWTTLRARKAAASFLRDELSIDAATAELAALALSQLEVAPAVGPCPDLPQLPPRESASAEAVLFSVVGGGYVELRFREGFLHATVSVPSARQHLSFGPSLTGLLRGVVRSHAVHTERVAIALLQEEISK